MYSKLRLLMTSIIKSEPGCSTSRSTSTRAGAPASAANCAEFGTTAAGRCGPEFGAIGCGCGSACPRRSRTAGRASRLGLYDGCHQEPELRIHHNEPGVELSGPARIHHQLRRQYETGASDLLP